MCGAASRRGIEGPGSDDLPTGACDGRRKRIAKAKGGDLKERKTGGEALGPCVFAAAEAFCTSCPFLHVFAKKIAQCFPPCSEFAAFHNSLQNRLSVSFSLAVAPFAFPLSFFLLPPLHVPAALSLFTVLTSAGVKWKRLRRHRGGREEEGGKSGGVKRH